MKQSNFEKYPEINIEGYAGASGWEAVKNGLLAAINDRGKNKTIVSIDCYQGVAIDEVKKNVKSISKLVSLFETSEVMKSQANIDEMVQPYVTNDPVFGYITSLDLIDFFDLRKVQSLLDEISAVKSGVVILMGEGAQLLFPDADIKIYADMPRWEIQLRFRNKTISNLGADNKNGDFSYQYKRAFFVDWRVLDKHKKAVMNACDFFLDTTIPAQAKMITGEAIQFALKATTQRPFRVVPFFDPGPWGGQWLKEVCDLDRNVPNFAWGFDCVIEENSMIYRFGDCSFEIPSVNLVYAHPEALLGKKTYEAFGAEFPIRFDFLDTMGGGNLSLQVHPQLEYIREQFGMGYTQDESYYILDAREDAFVYLGLKESIVPAEMLNQLEAAQQEGLDFDADEFVEKWPIKKHDHIHIPAGTIHCSGANSAVLEISATPYIFTFKLWDWGRMGLDGRPRPISLEHGKNAIQWDRTSKWIEENILNKKELIVAGEGWKEEKTGLDINSFIETRRHWFKGTVTHNTQNIVNVLNLVEGAEVIVESPTHAFEPYIIHYAETFIVPAAVGAYTIRPYGKSIGKECATIKASIRTEQLINYQLN